MYPVTFFWGGVIQRPLIRVIISMIVSIIIISSSNSSSSSSSSIIMIIIIIIIIINIIVVVVVKVPRNICILVLYKYNIVPFQSCYISHYIKFMACFFPSLISSISFL